MKTTKIQLTEELLNDYNPRKKAAPGTKLFKDLKKSLDRFGLVIPLVYNVKTGHLVGGHQRAQVMLDAGETEAEAVALSLTLKEEKALNVALNKIKGRWDQGKLAELLAELPQDDLIGWEPDELKITEIALDSFEEEPEEGPEEGPEEEPWQKARAQEEGFSVYLTFTSRAAAASWMALHGLPEIEEGTRQEVEMP